MEKDLQQIKEKIGKVRLFSQIKNEADTLTELAKLIKIINKPKNDIVIREGEEGSEFYIIDKGTVEIIKKTRQGDEYTVTELSGDMNAFFGELALIDPDKRSATVRCKTDCTFYVIERNDFIKFGEDYPYPALLVTREIAKILCQRLRKADNDILTLFDALLGEVELAGGIE